MAIKYEKTDCTSKKWKLSDEKLATPSDELLMKDPSLKTETTIKLSKFITVFSITSMLWVLCLCGVVFFINGTFPAVTAEIPGHVWVLHFSMLLGMLVSFSINIIYWFKILNLTTVQFRQSVHNIFTKYVLAAGYFLSVVGMIVTGGFVKFGWMKWDWVCVFEYSVLEFTLTIMVEISCYLLFHFFNAHLSLHHRILPNRLRH